MMALGKCACCANLMVWNPHKGGRGALLNFPLISTCMPWHMCPHRMVVAVVVVVVVAATAVVMMMMMMI